MKQTAVQWLMHQMLEASMDRQTGEMYIKLPKDAFQQAKAMEKEQIVEAYYYDPNCDEIKDDGEQYYNETFKSE